MHTDEYIAQERELTQERDQLAEENTELKLSVSNLEHELSDHNAPCAHALDLLWKEIILSKWPKYGDWEYPGQAFNHILQIHTEYLDQLESIKDQLKYNRGIVYSICGLIDRTIKQREGSVQITQQEEVFELVKQFIEELPPCVPSQQSSDPSASSQDAPHSEEHKSTPPETPSQEPSSEPKSS